jgi:hypothetical protein
MDRAKCSLDRAFQIVALKKTTGRTLRPPRWRDSSGRRNPDGRPSTIESAGSPRIARVVVKPRNMSAFMMSDRAPVVASRRPTSADVPPDRVLPRICPNNAPDEAPVKLQTIVIVGQSQCPAGSNRRADSLDLPRQSARHFAYPHRMTPQKVVPTNPKRTMNNFRGRD